MSAPALKRQGPVPPVVIAKTYKVTIDGKAQELSEAQYQAYRAKAIKKMLLRASLIEDEAQYNRTEQIKWFKEVHGEHWYSVGSVSDVVGGAKPPPDTIWTKPMPAVDEARRAIQEGRLEDAANAVARANGSLQVAKSLWLDYLGQTVSGAEDATKALELTRDISFTIAISAAAIVAAPVVATAAGTALGAGGVGLTGTALTAATFGTSATAITVGGGFVGGVLRGGTNLAGQALTGDKINAGEAWKEAKTGVKKGAVDAGSTFVGGAAGELLGAGAKGISVAQKVIRGAGGGMAGGAFGGGLNATLEGKSAGEVVHDTLHGAASGTLGGAVGSGLSGLIPNAPRLVQSVGGGVVGSGLAAGTAYLEGAKPDEIKAAAISAGIQGFAMGQAKHESGFGFGQGGAELQQRFGKPPDKPPPPAPKQQEPVRDEAVQENQRKQDDARQEQQMKSGAELEEGTQKKPPDADEVAAVKEKVQEETKTQSAPSEEPVQTAPDETPDVAARQQQEKAQKRTEKQARKAQKRAKQEAREAETQSQKETDEQYGSDTESTPRKRGGPDRDKRSDATKARQQAAKKLKAVVDEAMAEGATGKSLASKQKLVARVIRLAPRAGLSRIKTNSLVGKVDEAARTQKGYEQEPYVRGIPMQEGMDPRAPRAIPDQRKARLQPGGTWAKRSQNLKGNNLKDFTPEQCVRAARSNTAQARRNDAHIPIGDTIELQYVFEPRGDLSVTPLEIMQQMNEIHFAPGSPISAVHYGSRVFRNPNMP